jgi:hypothetical protein
MKKKVKGLVFEDLVPENFPLKKLKRRDFGIAMGAIGTFVFWEDASTEYALQKLKEIGVYVLEEDIQEIEVDSVDTTIEKMFFEYKM